MFKHCPRPLGVVAMAVSPAYAASELCTDAHMQQWIR